MNERAREARRKKMKSSFAMKNIGDLYTFHASLPIKNYL